MKILIFTESYFPVINGVSVSTRILCRGLCGRGHEVSVAAPANNNTYDGDEHVFRTSSFCLKSAKDYPIPNILKLGELSGIIDDYGPDCVLAQIPFTYGIAAKSICRRKKIPFASFCHTLYTEYVHYCPVIPHTISSALMKKYLAAFYNSCDAVATPSHMMFRELRSFGVNGAVDIIPTGIEMPGEINTGNLKENLGIRPDETVYVYMSRVAKEKNLDLLVSAFEKAAEELPSSRLLIIGGGPYLEYMKNRTKSMRGKVLYTGMVNKNQVYDYLGCGDVFVFPSVTETQGLAVCEAQASGLPVAAVRAGGTPENILEGKTGLLSENNAAAFAEIMITLGKDAGMRCRMSDAAKEFSQNFSIEKMLDRYETFFDKLVNKETAGGR